ncbi:MAG: amino acid adenylation domain-containing protein, partial [Clostridia bacterium]|nr:amino acid adenylation domain-containing protein [Clostridia bacterium]
MEQFSGGAIAVICTSFFVKGKKTEEEMQVAANELFRINEALRIKIIKKDNEITQHVCDFYEQKFDVLHFTDDNLFENYADIYAKDPIDLTGRLCEIKIVVFPDKYGLLVKIHHIISDAWTVALLATQFNLLLKGENPPAYSYFEYCHSEKKYLDSKRYLKDKEFFLEQFRQCEEPVFISEKNVEIFEAERKVLVIDAGQAKKIREFAEKMNCSVLSVWATALAIYMSRMRKGAEKFFVGTTVLNRHTEKDFNTVGMFVNTAPVLLEASGKKTFLENLEKTEDTLMSVFRHQKYNYENLIEDIRRQYGECDKLYDIILSYMNATIGGTTDGVSSTWHHNGRQNESLQINFDDRDNEGIFKVQYDYQTEKFNEKEIEILHGHLCCILFDAIENPDKKISDLEMLSADEKQTILSDFNDTTAEYPKDKCVHQLFEEEVEKTPDKEAVIACDKTLTYRELNEEANTIARALISKGVKPDDYVCFDLKRNSRVFSSMFGIMKAGATFVPVNNDYPEERKRYIIADCKAAFVITEDNIEQLLNCGEYSELPSYIDNEKNCYCIYTSGSTGKPKGTLITHKNVSNLAHKNKKNMCPTVIKEEYSKICSFASVGFDMFIAESLLPLLNGKTVVFASEEQSILQKEAALLFKKTTPDIFQCTPTKLKMLISDKDNCDYLKTVRSIIIGGESFDPVLYDELKNLTDAEIYNFYGPTEATVWVSYAKVENAEDITVGRPMANTQIYIVDKYMKPVPIGVTGELCIAGDNVGQGYLNRPELTAEKFIDNPFGEGKLYKTGDLAYWREDGNIIFVGRNDFQVKIRGLRIELGEIENAISGVEGINMSVAVVRKNSEGRQLICAFYTGEEKSSQEIRSDIGEKLPKYMLPHIFTHLDEMPLTSSGKISRNALPEIDLENISTETEYIAPESEREIALTECAGEILGAEKISV